MGRTQGDRKARIPATKAERKVTSSIAVIIIGQSACTITKDRSSLGMVSR